jgi:PTS system nitrogen regulatory IIA component
MQLTVRDASKLLSIPEKTIYRLIKHRDIPFYRLQKSFFFNRTELLEWAIAKSVGVSPNLFEDSASPTRLPLLADALERGGIHRIAGGKDKRDILKSVVSLVQDLPDVHRAFMFEALCTRESLGSTAIGGGIAIPHVRNPIVLNIKSATILLCFLDTPVDFGAIDGVGVSTLFTMISPTARVHLHLLARLSYFLCNKSVKSLLAPDVVPSAILACIRDAETHIPSERK